MRLGICKNCGTVFDEDDLQGGYCYRCPEYEDEKTKLQLISGCNNKKEDKEKKLSMLLDLTGDCV